MTKFLRRLVVVLSGALLALGTAGVSPAQAATNVGGVDLDWWCQSYGYKGAKPIGSTAYDWRCVDQNDGYQAIDIPLACRILKATDAVDRIANFYDRNSWQCWRTSRVLGGLNLNGYCQSKTYVTARPIGSTAYDWRCVTSSGGLAGIDVPSACKWQYPQYAGVIDRFANFYDRNSWECRV